VKTLPLLNCPIPCELPVTEFDETVISALLPLIARRAKGRNESQA
jgi:hypothetical protein